VRLSDLEVRMLLPGHNRVLRDVPEGYIRAVAKQWEAYLG
jgi:hypothetical protein